MKKFFAIFAVAAMLFACEEPVPETTLALDDAANATLNLSTAAATKVVAFTTNAAWTAADDAEWINVTPASGVAGAAIELTIEVEENTTYDARAGKVTITAGDKNVEIAVNQSQTDEVNIGEEETLALTIGYEGGEVKFPVNHNVEFTVTSDAEWAVVAEGTKALTTTEVVVEVAKNTTGAARVANLTVEAEGGFVYEVVLTQGSNVSTVFSVNSTTVVPQVAAVTLSDQTSVDEKENEDGTKEYFYPQGIVSIALYDGKLVVCPGDGSATKLVNKATGEVEGDLVTGGFVPYYVANDDAGNLVMSNRVHNNVWTGEYTFEVWYLVPGSTTAVKALAADWQTRHNGCGMAVRGDITKNATVLVPSEMPNGGGENTVNGWEFVEGKPAPFKSIKVSGFEGASNWFGSNYWRAAPYVNSFALMGTTINEGAVMLDTYPGNDVYVLGAPVETENEDGSISRSWVGNAVATEVFDSNCAPNAIDMINVNGKAYVALSAACHWASYAYAPMVVFCVEGTTITPVAAPASTPYCTTDYISSISSDVCLEAVDGGLNVYHLDNPTASLEAFFIAL